MNKRGQVALFVIIAIVVVGLVVAFVLFRDRIGLSSIPSELQPVFAYYDSCIEDALQVGVSVAGQQGGWVEPEAYVPGSDYNPFSSQLFFAGARIPYWFSLEGNNVARERVPTRTEVQDGIARFVGEQARACDFALLRAQGFSIQAEEPRVSVRVDDSRVVAQVTGRVSASKGEVTGVKSTHEIELSSPFGSLYKQAVELYDRQKSEAFLDNYAADVLRLYAPVDGVVVQCSPEFWNTHDVVNNITDALEANFAHIRFGDQSSVSDEDERYFTVDSSHEASTRVIYSPEWPRFIEISPASDAVMAAEPVGNQEGMGIMGFCYVPYHFLYDVRFPALIQLTEGTSVFQFPVVVIVDKNTPRAPLANGTSLALSNEPDVCAFKEGNVRVSTFSSELNPIAARISYQCLEQRCELGNTRIVNGEATLDAAIPTCVNGYLIASAENYTDSKMLFSSNREQSAELVLDRSYSVRVSVRVDGQTTTDMAVVHFTGADGTVSTLIPGEPMISLPEGLYNVSVFVYGSSNLTLPATTRQECVEVPKGGILGIFGGSEENCFDVTSPAVTIDSALRAGGSAQDVYLLASELQGGELVLYVSSLPRPTSLEQLQTNFELFEDAPVEVGSS